MDDNRMWAPSPSPEESWSDASGADENGEWPVHGVVGEEIRLADGSSRYEVRWLNWYRKDGSNTNTTWAMENTPGVGKVIKDWKRKQSRIRRSLADTSLDMEVPWPDDAVHLRFTDHHRQGYAEKLDKQRQAGPTSTTDWDAEIDWREQEIARTRVGRRKRETSVYLPTRHPQTGIKEPHRLQLLPRLTSPSLLARHSNGPAVDHQLLALHPPPPDRLCRPPRLRTNDENGFLTLLLQLAPPGSLIPAPSTLPAVIVAQPTMRGRISSDWNKAAKEAKAATVRISPDIIDENLPRTLRRFKYLEEGYHFRDEALQKTFKASRGAFTMCDCSTCSDTSDCPCRDISKIYDLPTTFSAYSKGLFTFKLPRGIDVIECNRYCRCGPDCDNRVVQRPRDISIEIFETKRCGWGARALEDIPKGKVLGTYTGRREEVDELPEEHHGYLFDLDSTEVRDSANLGEKYSVNSYEYGNWTRFVNHSCSPNMCVYCVVYDTIPYVNMPYVAFVASTNIVAGTELTIDYYPFAEVDKKGKRPADGESCRCGSSVQIMENIRQQSCEGLALPFLFNWMLGDASNLIGCLLTRQLPFQTYLATYFCSVDCVLLCQYFYYGGGPKTPPISYPHARARSRTTSSARRPPVDASHYRTLSTAASNIAVAAALAAHPDSHPEHRRSKKLGGDLLDEYTPSCPEEPQDEVSDAVPPALSESFYSENGRRKRVSWSQERQEHSMAGSSTRHMSPVVPGTHRHSVPSTAALLARGRPLRREDEAEVVDEEEVVESQRRNASRASRRSAGMVLLGMGVLFGIGRYSSGTRPVIGRGLRTGEVLVSSSDVDLSPVAGLPVVEGSPNHIADSSPSFVDVELPSLPNDTLFSHQRQPDKDVAYDRIIGRIFAWLCTILYLTSRLPQIWKNYVRKSVEGLSIYLFIFAFLGNFFYVLSILTSPEAHLPPPASTEFFRESIPYLLGSGGTFVFDITIVTQSIIYKGRHPRRSYIRSRGNSIVRSTALAEETAGLLRGDALATARAHSDWAHADSVGVARSQSRS
ncbi:hypothetical protein JVU11DRAFT_963 [Chiua virens]|nr:hypothetical protein JVU11DRAFT_963 [Chiua virens]